jgi:uncharacterized protein DUF4325
VTQFAELSIAQDFTPFPGGRTREDGPFSGAYFRDEILGPLLADGGHVVINLDGVAGLPSSFWEEVFGGLIRESIVPIQEISTRLKLRTSEPELEVYIPMAYKYAKDVAEANAA